MDSFDSLDEEGEVGQEVEGQNMMGEDEEGAGEEGDEGYEGEA